MYHKIKRITIVTSGVLTVFSSLRTLLKSEPVKPIMDCLPSFVGNARFIGGSAMPKQGVILQKSRIQEFWNI